MKANSDRPQGSCHRPGSPLYVKAFSSHTEKQEIRFASTADALSFG